MFAKQFVPSGNQGEIDPLCFYIKHGPRQLDLSVDKFVIPIQRVSQTAIPRYRKTEVYVARAGVLRKQYPEGVHMQLFHKRYQAWKHIALLSVAGLQ